MSTAVLNKDKKADLAGPGIGDYKELGKVLPPNYRSLLSPKETQQALYQVKRYIADNLCHELNLMMVEVPLIVDVESGVNDMLDRDGSRTPIQFHISNNRNLHPIDAQVVQAATKWKRLALKQFDCKVGEGICTDMRAVRKDYFLDHDHSAYVDQWDWERVITAEQRNLEFLKAIVGKIWKVIVGAEKFAQSLFPQLMDKDSRYPNLPEKLTFLHAEEILDMYPEPDSEGRITFITKDRHYEVISESEIKERSGDEWQAYHRCTKDTHPVLKYRKEVSTAVIGDRSPATEADRTVTPDWAVARSVPDESGGTMYFVVIPEAKRRDGGYYRGIGNKLCRETPQCSVNFWTDRNHIPQSAWMPVPDLAIMTASYRRHPSYAEPRVQLACWLYPSKAIGEAAQCEYQPGAKRPPEK